jgi:branched-subunit amino acid transport protein
VNGTWTVVITASLACFALKAAGYVLPPRMFEPAPARRTIDLLPAALLAALVVTQAFGAGRGLALDARAPALLVAAVLYALRVPFLVVVVAAAVVAALLRALL